MWQKHARTFPFEQRRPTNDDSTALPTLGLDFTHWTNIMQIMSFLDRETFVIVNVAIMSKLGKSLWKILAYTKNTVSGQITSLIEDHRLSLVFYKFLGVGGWLLAFGRWHDAAKHKRSSHGLDEKLVLIFLGLGDQHLLGVPFRSRKGTGYYGHDTVMITWNWWVGMVSEVKLGVEVPGLLVSCKLAWRHMSTQERPRLRAVAQATGNSLPGVHLQARTYPAEDGG